MIISKKDKQVTFDRLFIKPVCLAMASNLLFENNVESFWLNLSKENGSFFLYTHY
jgi:hypothetical protein